MKNDLTMMIEIKRTIRMVLCIQLVQVKVADLIKRIVTKSKVDWKQQ